MISIVVPVLNEAQALPALLDALQSARAQGHEIVLVDGGSTDHSAELAVGKVDQLLFSSPGRARQMNLGARESRHSVIWFLHADSQVSLQHVQAIQQASDQGCRRGWFPVVLSGQSVLLRMVAWAMNKRSAFSGMATGDQGIFVTRELFDAAGGFPDIRLMEDLELCRKLKRQGKACVLAPALLTSSRRWEQKGVVRTIVLMWSLRLAWWLGVSPERLANWYYPR